MGRYIIKRMIQLIPILIGVTFLSFLLMYIAPSDPAERELTAHGMQVSPEVLEAKREDLGLNQPFLVQYARWVRELARGNLGTSYATGRPAAQELGERLPYTILLAICAVVVALAVSIPLGIWSAARQNRASDYLIRFCTFIGTAIPRFLLALLLIYVFALQLKWLPVLGGTGWKSLILPVITLSLPLSGQYIRQIRAAILDEMQKDYVTGAVSRGLKKKTVWLRYVLKNVLGTIITLTGLSIGALMGGTIVVETIFVWPGIGKLFIDSIGARDYTVIQGYVVWTAFLYVTVNALVDLFYSKLDPRVRTMRGSRMKSTGGR